MTGRSRQTQAGEAEQAGRLEEWLRPLDRGDDTGAWETRIPVADGSPGPRGSCFVLDLNAEQTAWLYDQSEAANVTPIEYLKRLVDEARRSTPTRS